jgi:hypothetical protein
LPSQPREDRGWADWSELQPPAADRLAASPWFHYRKPEAMPHGLGDAKQQAFIDEYENLLNTMGNDEAVVFIDAVHPTHQVRPAGCWARKGVAIAVETGRDRPNIHGARRSSNRDRDPQLSRVVPGS